MEFRLAAQADLKQLAQMRWEYWAEGGLDPAEQDEKAFVDKFIGILGARLNKDWFVWCAVEGEEILSHIYVELIPKVPKPSRLEDAFGYVSNALTRRSHRNAGIGSRLMEHMKSWALKRNLEFLVLWPSPQSKPFWARSGFSVGDPLILEIRPYVF